MAKDGGGSRQQHLRQLVAQHAARMMAEDGITDYAQAKRKASRQLGVEDAHSLPSNAEILQELRIYQDIYLGEEQPGQLRMLRSEALAVMRLLQQFHPYLTGAVLDGTAGRYAETDISLVADSDKDVEMFLLNQGIPYEMQEKSYHFNGERRKVPVFALEGPHGAMLLSVFPPGDFRQYALKGAAYAKAADVEALLESAAV